MSDRVEIQQAVREKYGKAALHVVDGKGGAASCCGGGDSDPVTRDLYEASQTTGLPAEAVLALRHWLRARPCSIWVPVAGSTCCSPRGASLPAAKLTAST